MARVALLVLLSIRCGLALAAEDAMQREFIAPPDSAKPRVWWGWVNGQVTEQGARLDLEWMKRIGIGGLTQNDVDFTSLGMLAGPSALGAQPVEYASLAWRNTLHFSVDLAARLGLEFAVDSSAGWSESGGPSVKPQQAMKKLVWSETAIEGGRPFTGRLPKPPETTGLFQNIPLPKLGTGGTDGRIVPIYYADIATLAYRAPDSEVSLANLKPTVTSSAGAIDAARLSDGDLASSVSLPFGAAPQAWIRFSFQRPQRIQALTVVVGPAVFGFNPLLEIRERGWLEASLDGQMFNKIADLPVQGAPQQTVSFAPIVAREFRVVFARPQATLMEQMGLASAATVHQIAELVLHTGARVNRFEDKAGFSTRQILDEDDTPAVAAGDAIPKAGVIDLTGKMRTDGSLDWTPPPGRWIVLRFGYSLIGRTNVPASRAGTGLEVDKLNREYVKAYIDQYLDLHRNALGKGLMGAHGLQYVLMDSNEAGAQNWTDDMLKEFAHRRGYDALPWLPVLAGYVIESAVASDRFLWDFRKTLADLMADAHYQQIASSLHQRGLGLYAESHEIGRAFIGDGMAAKKAADIPMGAMWVTLPVQSPELSRANYDADILESASVAHIYGKNLVAGESFTALGNTYGFDPQALKPIADRELAMGVNRFAIASSHQPDSETGPRVVDQWFTRHATWAEQAGSWMTYLARSSYLLQQGRFVADIVYFYGEDTNATSVFKATAVPIPEGYNFDFINPEALLNELSVKNGRLVTRGGMQYRLLALDASTRRMSLPVLRKLDALVRAGAVVVGAKPVGSPSLSDDQEEYGATVARMWGNTAAVRALGEEKGVADRSLAAVLKDMSVAPDVAIQPGEELYFVHRLLPSGDIFFINSNSVQRQSVEMSFRVSGRRPELWRADTGNIMPLPYRVENGRTIVPLQLEAEDAVFVVFRQPVRPAGAMSGERERQLLATVDGPWKVTFPIDPSAPAEVRFDQLVSWTGSADREVKYFSGTATYDRTLSIPEQWLRKGAREILDLGDVKDLAEVLVNGRSIGILWKAPFELDVTDACRVGENRLQIKVTNLWVNRLIGAKQKGIPPIASANVNPFNADSRLMPSGLLGPVRLLTTTAQ
jgi:hypothetical protein